MFEDWLRRRHLDTLRERALRYAANGWPVAPLAVPRDGSCPCRLRDCVEPHLVGEAVTDPVQVAIVWDRQPWDLALPTSSFDVVDVPARFGALLNQLLKTTCPTAMAPAHRRWWFFLVPGSIPAAQVRAADGVLHSGPDDWVAAPGTNLEYDGRVRWLVHPGLTGWRPYQRRDAVDEVFF
ncbi:hypothetical protein Kfla_6797 [Kribbella flavida DSM 17836]|uniref:DNA primase/polymerase bifunctional N-terminal domain-containing protein n=1 Tax=Kribbella flavida (strain DSM 17836 / JCM 10339 / NBRC 14399) TaxID=479435 RepID=D2Q292_KRIFD|nr:bifunctional DNA primase/polymerase [Kribbella flavida]ADB35788.1 hypothetical protein Kfla_6797 [Kribbella flavida DSM 17836]